MSVTETLAARVEALCGDLSRIRAPRGGELNARQWSTEAPLRMLLNNLDREVAERPEELVVYGGSGKAARNHGALRAIVGSLLELGPDETLGPPLRDARELGHGHRKRIECERQRLAVEVPVGNEGVVVDEHQRVVRRGVQLHRDGVVGVVEEIARGAVYLRRAAQGVRVLHLVAPPVRLVDRGAFE